MSRPSAIKMSVAAAILTTAFTLALSQEPKEPSFRGRLPAHYGEIVTEAQRLQIYGIQEKYDKQISALTDQLQTLKKKRAAEIDAVLNDDQRSRLKKKQDESSAARTKGSSELKKVAK
jgi:hypothetical protein